MNYLKLDIKLFLVLSFAFTLMTVIGTLSHEFGHYSVARLLGYEAAMNYQSSWVLDNKIEKEFFETNKKHQNEIINNIDFPEKEKYEILKDKYISDHFWITVGGPLQTILTGSIGLLLLILFKNNYIQNNKLNLRGWLLIFLTLFWLRQSANLFVATLGYLKRGKTKLSGDEMVLASQLDINLWTIQILTGLTGLLVLGFVVFKILPKKTVLTFLLSGLFGGIAGYYLWLIKYGQLIMP